METNKALHTIQAMSYNTDDYNICRKNVNPKSQKHCVDSRGNDNQLAKIFSSEETLWHSWSHNGKTHLEQLKPPQTERTIMRIMAIMIPRTISFIFIFWNHIFLLILVPCCRKSCACKIICELWVKRKNEQFCFCLHKRK